MFSKIKIKKLVLWLVIIMVCSAIIGMAGILLQGNSRLFGADVKDAFKIDIEKSFSMDGINKINVKSVSSDIKIIPAKTNDIKVHLYGSASSEKSAPKLETGTCNGGLNIEINHTDDKLHLFNTKFYTLKLDVYVPENYSDSLKLSTVSGKMQINDMNFDKFEFDSTSGGLDLLKVNFKEMKFTTTSGDANLRDISGSINYYSVSGSIHAVLWKYDQDITIETKSGSGWILLPQNTGFGVDFKTKSGDFNTDFPAAFQSKSKTEIVGKVHDGKNFISFSSISGNLNIDKLK